MHSFLNQENAQLWIFFCCCLFIKVSFCFQYFHINLLAFEFGQESEKGADSGFTIGSRESIYNWGWLEWCKEVHEPLCLSKTVSLPEWRGRASQCTSVSQLGGADAELGLAQGRWRHAAGVVARINSVKDSTTPDDKRWEGHCRWSSRGKIPGCQSHDMESGQYGSRDRRWKEARSWRLDF